MTQKKDLNPNHINKSQVALDALKSRSRDPNVSNESKKKRPGMFDLVRE